jgi:hypothetical protein
MGELLSPRGGGGGKSRYLRLGFGFERFEGVSGLLLHDQEYSRGVGLAERPDGVLDVQGDG